MMRKTFRSPRSPRRGTVVALVALAMPLLVGVMAIGLDGSLMYLQRRQAQSIADGAALAGAYQLYLSSSNVSGAKSAASTFVTNAGGTNATVVSPPTSGTFSGNTNCIQVTATVSQPRFFSALWGSGTMTATATSTARGGGSQPYSSSAIVLLNPNKSGSLAMSNSAQITAPAGIQVNSSSATAVTASNSAQTSAPINIVGGDSVTNSAQLSGTVTTGAPSVSNPLSSLSTPSVPAATTTTATSYANSTVATMQPGLYTSSVTISNSANVTMASGTYYFQGSSLTVANSATLSGSGVTIYMDTGSLNFSNSATVTLSAPTSGTYQGIVYFQSPTSTASPSLSNSASVKLTGTFYAAGAALSFSNSSDLSAFGTQLIVSSLSVSNSAVLNVPWSSGTVAGKTSSFGLVD